MSTSDLNVIFIHSIVFQKSSMCNGLGTETIGFEVDRHFSEERMYFHVKIDLDDKCKDGLVFSLVPECDSLSSPAQTRLHSVFVISGSNATRFRFWMHFHVKPDLDVQNFNKTNPMLTPIVPTTRLSPARFFLNIFFT